MATSKKDGGKINGEATKGAGFPPRQLPPIEQPQASSTKSTINKLSSAIGQQNKKCPRLSSTRTLNNHSQFMSFALRMLNDDDDDDLALMHFLANHFEDEDEIEDEMQALKEVLKLLDYEDNKNSSSESETSSVMKSVTDDTSLEENSSNSSSDKVVQNACDNLLKQMIADAPAASNNPPTSQSSPLVRQVRLFNDSDSLSSVDEKKPASSPPLPRKKHRLE